MDDHSRTPAADALDGLDDPRLQVIHQNPGLSGVASARNLGIERARSDIFAFLDDDDELYPHYITYIREVASLDADYGFASYLKVNGDDNPINGTSKTRLAEGVIHPNAPFRKRAFGFGMGFWMHRKTSERIGPLDRTLTINEDTDYACRLLRADARGWYSAKAGVIVHEHFGSSDAQKPNMTKQISAVERARCMKELCTRYPEQITHLGKSYIRHCLQSGDNNAARNFIRAQSSFATRLRLNGFLKSKAAAYRLKAILSRKH